MKKIALIVIMLLFVAGCQRGDFQASLVIEGQIAPHAGYNFGPDLYILPGEPCRVTGLLVNIEGMDPNTLWAE